MRGRLEFVSLDRVIGWAYDPDRPDEPVSVDILDGADVILRFKAERFRQDLKDAGFGNGHHQFNVALPPGLLPLPVHVISARISGTEHRLEGGPYLLRQPEQSTPTRMAGWLESRISALAANAKSLSDMTPMVDTLFNGLARLLERARALDLGEEAVVRPATHSWASLPDDVRHMLDNVYPRLAPLHFPYFPKPELSVVIAATGSIQEAYACLLALLKAPPRCPYELVLVDGSGGVDTIILPFIAGGHVALQRVARSADRRALWQQGARLARSERLVLLDARTHVQPGALDALAESFDLVADGDAIAPRHFSQDGRLLAAGYHLNEIGKAEPRCYGTDPAAAHTRVMAPVDVLSQSALALRKPLLEALPPVTHDWGDYADAAFSLELRRLGANLHVQGCADVVVIARPEPPRAQRRDMHRVFLDMYQQERLALSKSRVTSQGRILFYDLKWPTPDEDAGSLAAIGHAVALRKLGYTVEFMALQNQPDMKDPGRPLLLRGIEATTAYGNAEAHLAARAPGASALYFHRIQVAEQLLPVAEGLGQKIPTLYSVADLHYLRMEREAALAPEPGRSEAAAAMKTRELAALARADSIITHSPVEAALIREAVPAARVTVSGWPVALGRAPLVPADRNGIGFVGGYLHGPNRDAAQHIAQDILPALRTLLPDAEILLAGSHMPPDIMALQAPGLRIVGYQRNLAAFFGGLRLTIAPLRFGAGIKGKVLSSFAAGVPCVMTPVAAEGLELPEPLCTLVVDEPQDFARRIAEIHEDEPRWLQLAEAARLFIAERYSEARIMEELAQALARAREAATGPLPDAGEGQSDAVAGA